MPRHGASTAVPSPGGGAVAPLVAPGGDSHNGVMGHAGPARKRLFLALMPDASVLSALRDHVGSWHWPAGSRLTPAAQLHITLHFLGQVDAARQAVLQAALAQTRRFAPITLVLDTPQCWSRGLAVLLPAEHAALHALHERLAGTLKAVGFASERGPWSPHVTLARRAGGAAPPVARTAIEWRVVSFALVWSRPSQAPRYQVLQQYPGDPDPP
jgi:RNA 2',3'-cyclic 3'-phosphodiesterase